jgi:hypothetical protein
LTGWARLKRLLPGVHGLPLAIVTGENIGENSFLDSSVGNSGYNDSVDDSHIA